AGRQAAQRPHQHPSVRHAVVVCAITQAESPRLYPFALQTLYWPFEDPVAFEGSPEAQLERFREVRDKIEDRLRAWVAELTERARSPGCDHSVTALTVGADAESVRGNVMRAGKDPPLAVRRPQERSAGQRVLSAGVQKCPNFRHQAST